MDKFLSQNLNYEALLNLAPNPSFEDDEQGINGWYPLGIVVEESTLLKLANGISHTGKKSMKVEVGPSGPTKGKLYFSSYNAGEGERQSEGYNGVRGVRTIAYRLDRDIRALKASVWIKSPNSSDIQLQIKWYSRNGRRKPVELTHTDTSFEITESQEKWTKYEIESIRPHLTHQAQLCIETTGDEPFYVDDVYIVFPRFENLQILVDQLGYEPNSQTKEILLQSSIIPENISSTFTIINLESLEEVFENDWIELGYHKTFDRYYWRGDFSALKRPGTYIIETQYGEETITSVSFDIKESITEQPTRLAYEFFYYQRCGTEISGFHKACHLDDAIMPDGIHRDLTGGWHDAGDYNKYNIGFTPESVYALALAYSRKKEFFDKFDRDNDGICDILDEAIWGAKYLYKCLDLDTYKTIGNISTGYRYWGKPEDETDNVPGSDDRPVTDGYINPGFLVGGFALVGKYSGQNQNYVSLAEDIYRQNGGSTQDLIALYQATKEEKYLDELQKQVRKMLSSEEQGLSQFRSLSEYALAFPSDSMNLSLSRLAQIKYDEISSVCDKYFHVRQYRDSSGNRHYFRQYGNINDWYVGESSQVLEFAYTALILARLGIHEARKIAEEQLHWIFGRNPFNTSLMEGIGKIFVPCYHHRYNTIPGNPRGAVPGAILNGITRAFPWIDRPWLDLNPMPTGEFQSNEPWLPHNIWMLYVMSIF